MQAGCMLKLPLDDLRTGNNPVINGVYLIIIIIAASSTELK